MLRRNLLVILASVFVISSARVELEEERENWAAQKPFQIILSWYLTHAYAVTVQVIHTQERHAMYHASSRFIREIHGISGTTSVAIVHHMVEAEDYQKSYELRETDHRSIDGNKSLSKRIDTHKAPNVALSRGKTPQLVSNEKWQGSGQPPLMNCSDCMTILMIADEITFQAFLDRGGFWRRNKVKLMLIISVPKSSNTLCHGAAEKRGWKKSVRNILRRVWSEDKVLNIFLFAPTLACIKDYLFGWDPFATKRNGTSEGALKRLKINPEDPDINKALSDFVIQLKDMNGYPLKVTIFERVPTLLAESTLENINEVRRQPLFDVDRITGLDGLILKTFSSLMNCSVRLFPPSDETLYGWMTNNGTFLGMVGDIVYRRVDFGANGIYLKDYQTNDATEFTVPISSESICIAVPRAAKIPQWLQIFQCFSPLVWTMLFVNVVISGLLRQTLRILPQERRPSGNLLETVIETTLIFVGSPQNLPKLDSERILVGFYLLFNVIVIGTFQGTLYEGFTNPKYFASIDTLEQLDNSEFSIGTGSPNLLDIFGDDDDSPVLSNLRKKMKIEHASPKSGTIDRAAWKRDIAAIERRKDLELNINTKFLDEHGETVLHIVDECPRSYQLTFMVPSGAFFLRRLNILLRRMVEAGLTVYWYNSTVELLIMKSHYAMAKKLELNGKTQPFGLENLQTSFIVLGSGLLLSMLVFVGEMVIGRRKIPPRSRMPKITIARRNLAPSSESFE